MDSKSHILFAKCLLEHIDDKITSPEWGRAPDLDMKFLHRWYRHRISVLPKIYKEFITPSKLLSLNESKDSISLCILSHLYLDIFNGWIFPFGICHPILPDETIINEILNDIDEPKRLVEDLKNLSGFTTFDDMFYNESEGIFKEFIKNLNAKKDYQLTEIIVRRLAIYANDNNYKLQIKAMDNIEQFTKNELYVGVCSYPDQMKVCEQFEIVYADLINRASGV